MKIEKHYRVYVYYVSNVQTGERKVYEVDIYAQSKKEVGEFVREQTWYDETDRIIGVREVR